MTTAAVNVLTAPIVVTLIIGFIVACIVHRPRRPAPLHGPDTTYWYCGQPITRADYTAIYNAQGLPHRLILHPAHLDTDHPDGVPWSCSCAGASGVGGTRVDAMGQHAAHTERITR